MPTIRPPSPRPTDGSATTVRLVETPRTTAKVVTPLWTVTKDAQRIDAELLDHGSAGWELRMSKNHVWLSGRRFSDRPNAIAHGEALRRDLQERGWRG
jgi:hypothetical protein